MKKLFLTTILLFSILCVGGCDMDEEKENDRNGNITTITFANYDDEDFRFFIFEYKPEINPFEYINNYEPLFDFILKKNEIKDLPLLKGIYVIPYTLADRDILNNEKYFYPVSICNILGRSYFYLKEHISYGEGDIEPL